MKVSQVLATFCVLGFLTSCGNSSSYSQTAANNAAKKTQADQDGQIATKEDTTNVEPSSTNPKVPSSGTFFTYHFKVRFPLVPCTTGRKKTKVLTEYCTWLMDEKLNNHCAQDARKELFVHYCSSTGINWAPINVEDDSAPNAKMKKPKPAEVAPTPTPSPTPILTPSPTPADDEDDGSDDS